MAYEDEDVDDERPHYIEDGSSWRGGYRTFRKANPDYGCCMECGADCTGDDDELLDECPACGSEDIDTATSYASEREDFRSDG
jgi:hypothetical protein